jgi:PmbA protein
MSASKPAIETARQVLDAARAAGATSADTVVVAQEAHAASVRLGEVESVELSRQKRLGLRCFRGRASAIASTADFSPSGLESFVRETVAMANVLPEDPDSGLPDESLLERSAPDLQLADPDGFHIDGDGAIAAARECERAALDADPRIRNSEGASFSASTSEIAYASSIGFEGGYRSTSHSLSVSPIADEDGAMQGDYWWDSARCRKDLADPAAIGRIAAARTLRRLGARKLATTRAPVIFEAPVAASLLGHLAGAICGGALYRKLSFLQERLGEVIASPLVQITDEGRLPGGPASRPFDAEGLPTRSTTIVKDGRLESFLLDTYAGRKLGRPSTGSASRSIGDAPGASPTNFRLAAGTTPAADLISTIPRGLLVTGLSGMGVNTITGDYSRGASGLWIEGGEIAYPVEEITIAGNLIEMFQSIDALGDDLQPRSGIAAPSLRIAEMTIAGS